MRGGLFEILGGPVENDRPALGGDFVLRFPALDRPHHEHGPADQVRRRNLRLHVADDRLGFLEPSRVQLGQGHFDRGRGERLHRQVGHIAPRGKDHCQHHQAHGSAGRHAQFCRGRPVHSAPIQRSGERLGNASPASAREVRTVVRPSKLFVHQN